MDDHLLAPFAALPALAAQAIGLSDPNPRVACRIRCADGRWFEGHTQAAGGPHAEVMALRAARAAGAALQGADVWVSLEPCSHHGRTPPCCDALIEAGVARVHVAMQDPNPLVSGQGLARLSAAGIAVTVLDPAHPIAQELLDLNRGFVQRMCTGRPWVRLKSAASLDGTTALHNGISQWITGPAARTDGHAWRRRAGAVLTGIGTVLADDPRLDVRLVPTHRQPLRVVLDSQLRLPLNARILPPPGQVLVYTTDHAHHPQAHQHLEALGVEVVPLPDASGQRVDLHQVVHDLGQRQVNELHVEAGSALHGAFWQAHLVDELLLYQAPMLLGPGRGLAQLPVATQMAQGLRLELIETTRIGSDLRVRTRTLR